MICAGLAGAARDHRSMISIDELRSYILTSEQLTARGFSSQSLSRAVASGALVRLRPGFYVEGHARDLARRDRHLLSILAADAALDKPVFTHSSAAMLHGLPDWGLPLGRVAVSRDGHARRSRHTRLTKHDLRPLAPEEIVTVEGISVACADRTIIDVARTCDRVPSIVAADAGLKGGLVTEESLQDALGLAVGRSGIKRARSVIDLTDSASESVAETRSRLYFSDYGLPEPQTQVEIRDHEGRFVARVDFFWPELGVIGECDGFGKYFDGADEAEVRRRLAAEKDRDARLAALGYHVIHWRWADLERPWVLIQRIRGALLANAA